MIQSKLLYLVISLYEEPNHLYSIYGQGINADTGVMELEFLGIHKDLGVAREHATLQAVESDCYVIETLKSSRQKAIDVNESIEIGGWKK